MLSSNNCRQYTSQHNVSPTVQAAREPNGTTTHCSQSRVTRFKAQRAPTSRPPALPEDILTEVWGCERFTILNSKQHEQEVNECRVWKRRQAADWQARCQNVGHPKGHISCSRGTLDLHFSDKFSILIKFVTPSQHVVIHDLLTSLPTTPFQLMQSFCLLQDDSSKNMQFCWIKP